jgi:hypothetical protein
VHFILLDEKRKQVLDQSKCKFGIDENTIVKLLFRQNEIVLIIGIAKGF